MTEIGTQRGDTAIARDLVAIDNALWGAADAITLRRAFLDDLRSRLRREMTAPAIGPTPTAAEMQGESCGDDSW